MPTTPTTSLPIVGETGLTTLFVLSSPLLPIAEGNLNAARADALQVQLRLAARLREVTPTPDSGPWRNWLQQRQALRRARLLRESGLPEASSRLYV